MSEQIVKMPVVAIRDMTILPGMLIHFDISREASLLAVNEAMEADQYIFITSQKDSEVEKPSYFDLFDVGVIAKVKQIVKLQEESIRIMVSTKRRATLMTLSQTAPFLSGEVIILESEYEQEKIDMTAAECEAAVRNITDLYTQFLIMNPRVGQTFYEKIKKEKNLGKLLDLVGMHVPLSVEQRQELLECFSVALRYEMLSKFIANEIEISKVRENFKEKVKEEVDKSQKNYFLREQMKVIREELGDGNDVQADEDNYRERLEKLVCSKEVHDKIEKEINRLKTISTSSSEYTVARGYVEALLDLPWDKESKDNQNLLDAEKVLNEDHYGLEKVKERILEFLAVRTLTGKGESPIICLVGPPGTGKTSIVRSVARALSKEYIRICLGGVRDEAEIRGHRRTYVGSMPGRLIDGLKKAKVKNPVMLLDEIDKVSSDYKGDTSSALLEVLDPEQNCHFIDHYIEIPVDLSEILFICTANSIDTIAKPLLDRMEVIELSGYTENEKFHIGKQYLVKKQLERNGLKRSQLTINDMALRTIISSYTREAGVRGLEREIGKVCRKTARFIVEGKEEKVRVSGKNIDTFLGRKKYSINEANKKAQIGIVRGLAWTMTGGSTLEIEVNIMPGKGKLQLTGQLGDVMKESAHIALSYVRSLDKYHQRDGEYFTSHDIHLHVPEGAVPKDGPSAGVTMATALYSAISKIKVCNDVAMTGEITLRGRVLPIGGLKEKLLAAKVAGIKRVLVPVENQPNIEEIEAEVKEGLEIFFMSTMQDVLAKALEGGISW